MATDNKGRPVTIRTAPEKCDIPTANSESIVGPDGAAWRAVAEAAILELASAGAPFDSADVRALGVPEPQDSHWWGLVYSSLHRRGLISLVGFTVSTRISLRGTAVRRWRGSSRLLSEGGAR